MTSNTTTTAVDVTPPRDYGGGDTWADAGEFYVPEDLREFYAAPAAEPSDVERAGYIKNGAQTTEIRQREIRRVISPGTADIAATTTTETQDVNCLVDLEGAAGYRTWLHVHRLGNAQRAKKRDDMRKVMESHWGTCPVCRVRDGSVSPDRVRFAGAELVVTACTSHLPVLAEAARAALVARTSEQTLPDGRRLGDVVDEVVRRLLDKAATR